jgi:hypothetical protein
VVIEKRKAEPFAKGPGFNQSEKISVVNHDQSFKQLTLPIYFDHD